MADGIRNYDSKEVDNLSLGAAGFDRIADTTQVTGKWVAIKAINADATLTVSGSTGTVVSIGDALGNGDKILEGDVWFGSFIAIKLATGTVLAYRG
jgi:hypothetical protein